MSRIVKIMAVTLLLAITALSFSAGCIPAIRMSPGQDQGLEQVSQAWDIIFDNYVEKDGLDTGKLSEGAIKGMVEALDDPHTSYLDAETAKLGLSSLEGKIEGIGAQVTVKDEQIVIIAPIAGSPAAQAGIRAGDMLLAIDGEDALGISLVEAILKIRGPEGTPVTLLVLHEGETEPEEIEIVRAEIELPSVSFEMRGDVAYINITHFTERTDKEISTVLDSMASEAATGIVLDLRSNPGGILEAVVGVASYFLEAGVVVSMVDNQGKLTTRSVESKKLVTGLPLIVLVDSYTASSGEVLASALQDNARATIAGTRTFGKGSVNKFYRLKDGSALYLTVGRWLTPNGQLIEGEGLYPDYELELEGEDAIEWAIDYLKGVE